jgi:hypothetical protein
MNNHKEDSSRSNPQMNANPDVMTALVNLAIYYMKRGETDYYRWAKNVLKEVGDEGIRPYLYKAWREAKQVIDKMPPTREEIETAKIICPTSSLKIIKQYLKKLLLMFLGTFIWLSMFIGMIELFYKILPNIFIDVFEHLGRKELDTENNMIYIISGIFSSLCFYSIYMGYKYYQKGYWGQGLPIPGKRVLSAFDRDELICKLEKKLNLSDKLDKIIEDSEYHEEDLENMKHQLSEVIKLSETKGG